MIFSYGNISTKLENINQHIINNEIENKAIKILLFIFSIDFSLDSIFTLGILPKDLMTAFVSSENFFHNLDKRLSNDAGLTLHDFGLLIECYQF